MDWKSTPWEKRIFTVLPGKLESITDKLRFPSIQETSFPEYGADELTDIRDFNTNFASLQNWFIHISFHEKVKFISKLLKHFVKQCDIQCLKELFDFFRPTKDILYGKTQYTHSLYDRSPMDEHRTKNLGAMHFAAESNALTWFHSLNEKEQETVIITLSQMGGGSLAYRCLRETLLLVKDDSRITPGRKDKRLSLPFEHEVLRDESLSNLSQKDDLELSRKESKYKSVLAKKEAEWQSSYSYLLEQAGNSNTRPKQENIDTLQMLPISINRMIYSHLDAKSKAHMRNVNKYWKAMGPEIQREENIREMINKLIKRHKLKATTFKGRTWATSGAKPVKGKAKKAISFANFNGNSISRFMGSVFTVNPEDIETVSKVGKSLSDPNLKHSLFELKTRSDFEISFKRKPHMKYPYTGKYTVIKISERFDEERVLAANKQWIAVSEGCSMCLHSLLTGAPMIGRLQGHRAAVTALVFHPSRSRLFSASYDTTVRYWDVYSRSLIHEFCGHESVVTSLSVNEVFLCSASMDLTIKVFDLSSGVIMWSFECSSVPSALAVDTSQTLFASSQSGHLEKILLTYDDFSKSVCPMEKLPEFSTDKNYLNTMQITEENNNPKCSEPDIKSGKSDFENDNNNSKTNAAKSDESIAGSTISSEKVRYAHTGEITSIFVESPLIFTAGSDGVVHVWHYTYFDYGPLMTLKHKGRRVNSVIVSYLLILTASEDGRLRIWDIESKSLKREIVVNPSGRPILSMTCIEVFDHSKVVFNNEDGILVMEFPFDWIKLKKFCSTNKKIKTPPKQLTRILSRTPSEVFVNYNFKNLPNKNVYSERRKNDLDVRLETLDEIQANDSSHIIANDISPILQALSEPGNKLRFDRYVQPPLDSGNLHVNIQEKHDPKHCLFPSRTEQILISKKDILPCMNPSKKVL